MATAESAQSAFCIAFGEVSKKVLCTLKMLKDFVCKWYPTLKVEVPAALLLHMTRCSIFSNSSIILPGLWASIGVTRSYSSHLFLCAFVYSHELLRIHVIGNIGKVFFWKQITFFDLVMLLMRTK